MPKSRLLIVLTAMLATCGIATTSASAHFTSSNGTSKGPFQLKAGTSALFALEEGGEAVITVACGEITKGEWAITKANEQLNLSGQFTKCTEKLAGLTNPLTVNSGCVLSVEQSKVGVTGGVAVTCVLTQAAKGCAITVAAGAPNTALHTITSVTVEAKNTEIKSNVSGFVVSTTKCGIKSTTGSFTSSIIVHEQLVV
jgi:hypothetical protein